MSGASSLGPKVDLSLSNPKVAFLLIGLAFLLALPLVAIVGDSEGLTYVISLVSKMMIFALAAASLDLLMGYGGLVSFGHAAYLGLGSYAVAVCAKYAVDYDIAFLGSGFLHFALAIVGSALFALLVGAVSLRTSGLYFIMITLAFTQMLYFLGVSLEPFGGDDGMNIDRSTFDFGLFELGFADNLPKNKDSTDLDGVYLYLFTLASLLGFLLLLRRIVNSRFGLVVRGAHSNEQRMQAIGFPVYRYRLTAFVIAGVICGWAGALLVNQTEFLTPDAMNWTQSGDLMIMVIMGGMGTIFGPVFGAISFIGLEEIFEQIFGQDYWRLAFGPLLVMLVLYARQGLFGMIPDRYENMPDFIARAALVISCFLLLIVHLEIYEGIWIACALGVLVVANALIGLFPRLSLPVPTWVLMASLFAIFCLILSIFGLVSDGDWVRTKVSVYALPVADLCLIRLFYVALASEKEQAHG